MIDKVATPVDGNKEVQDLFRKWLQISEKGDMKFAVIVACNSSDDVAADLAGVRGCEFAAYYGLDRIKRAITHSLENSGPQFTPDHNNKFPANHWMYLLDQWTTGYDFYQWLLSVELTRRAECPNDKLKVYFHPGEGHERDVVALAHPGRKELFYNVVRPLLYLFNGIETREVGGRIFDPLTMLSYRHAIEAYRRGIELPQFHEELLPKESWETVKDKLGNRNPVVLTLREAGHNSYRNSPIEEWIKFANWLKDKGEDVLFVRDTAKADEPIEGFDTFPEAARNLYVRYILYRHRSKACFFGTNGPHGLVAISDVPWATVYPLDDNKGYKWNNPDKWAHTMGIQPGEQLPWATPHQKILLKPENFENLKLAWQEVGLES